MKIRIEKPTDAQLQELNIESWSNWECEPSKFDWQYAEEETAYVHEGKVIVTTDTESVEINKGDLVTFPKGLACQWEVLETIKKVFRFNS